MNTQHINPWIIPGLNRNRTNSDRLDYILDHVCRIHDKSKEDVLSKNRKRPLVNVRKTYCYFAVKRYSGQISLADIGNHIGSKRDHSAVLWYINKYREHMFSEEVFRTNHALLCNILCIDNEFE